MELFKNGIEKIKKVIEKDEFVEAKEYVYKSLDKFKSYYNDCLKTFYLDFEKCKKGDLSNHNRDLLWFICLDILPYDQPYSWKKIIAFLLCI